MSMEHIDKEKYHHIDDMTHDDLPQGYSWEEMKGGIMQKMEASSNSASKPKPAYYWMAVGFAVALLFGGAMYFAYHFFGDQPSKIEPIAAADKTLKNSSNDLSSNKENSTKGLTHDTDRKINKITKNPSLIGSEKYIETRYNNSKTTENLSKNKQVQPLDGHNTGSTEAMATKSNIFHSGNRHDTQIVRESSKKPEITHKNIAQSRDTKNRENAQVNSEISPSESNNLSSIVEPSSTKQKSIEKAAELSVITAQLPLTTRNISLPDPFPFIPKPSSKSFSKNIISLTTGLCLWDTKYQGIDELSLLRNKITENLPGLYLDLGYETRIGRSFFARGQIGYYQLNTKFEDRYTYTEDVLIKNVITKRVTNGVSGDTTNVYGDVMGQVTKERHIRNYNNHALARLGITFGYAQEYGKLSLRAFAGPSIYLNISQSGKTYNSSGGILTFSNTNPLIKPKGINLMMGIGISYQIAPQYYLGLEGGYEISLSMWESDASGIKPKKYNMGLSLSRMF